MKVSRIVLVALSMQGIGLTARESPTQKIEPSNRDAHNQRTADKTSEINVCPRDFLTDLGVGVALAVPAILGDKAPKVSFISLSGGVVAFLTGLDASVEKSKKGDRRAVGVQFITTLAGFGITHLIAYQLGYKVTTG